MEPLTFQAAISQAKSQSQKLSILLGNGFSISLFSDIFSYTNLLSQADRENLFHNVSPAVRKAFDEFGTSDFELIINLLNNGCRLLNLYQNIDINLINSLKHDADELKNVLVNIISKHHPDNPSYISENQYKSCQRFLSHFDSIYTINYDLLLYWTIVHAIEKNIFKDGFEDPVSSSGEFIDEYFLEDYVKWSLGNETKANVFFLHGALHLYDAGTEVRKYCWMRTGISLKDQVLVAIDNKMYPLFVAEGSHEEKYTKINHNAYLSRCYRSFQSKGGVLFIFGLSLKQNDNHLCDAIIKGKFSDIYIGLFGNVDSEPNQEIIEKMKLLSQQRDDLESRKSESRKRYKTKPLKIHFFDSATAKVWNFFS